MLQMARKPFMADTIALRQAFRQGPRKSLFPPSDGHRPGQSFLIIRVYRVRALLSFSGASCGPFQHSWLAHYSFSARPQPPRVGFSSSPTMPTAMVSTSAWRKARSAAPTRHYPIADHGILRRLRPIAASSPTRLRDRCRRRARTARTAAATSTSPSPASASGPIATFASRKFANVGIKGPPAKY